LSDSESSETDTDSFVACVRYKERRVGDTTEDSDSDFGKDLVEHATRKKVRYSTIQVYDCVRALLPSSFSNYVCLSSGIRTRLLRAK
jgi:hypothetical protein